jgi:hypothetical protein
MVIRMVTYHIDKKRMASPIPPGPHNHIAAVHLTNGQAITRQAVIDAINRGDFFYTYGAGQAQVVVRACPFCNAPDYITTLPDTTTTNNLLSLPDF